MANKSGKPKRDYSWDAQKKIFVPVDISDDYDEDVNDLLGCSLEKLSGLPGWLVPHSRKCDLEKYKADRARKARNKLQDEIASRVLKRDRADSISNGNTRVGREPEVKYGPRGGRYTEDKTRDGRPYRRYF